MIGQDKLISKIENINSDTLPHSLILLGEKGSGRHTIFNMIVNKMCLPYFDITDKLSHELIDEIYLKVEPIIYLIDVDNISVKESNMILKLVEEPLKNAFIVFIGNNKANILPTILNRCQIWELERYTEEQLRYFLTTVCDNYPDYFGMLDYCNTPGDVLYLIQLNFNGLNDMKSMSGLIIDHIGTANFANTLTISDKLAFKNETDKWDYDIFIKVLHKEIYKRLVDNYSQPLYNIYVISSSLLKDSTIPHMNKKHLFENFLCTCRYVMR